MYTSLIALLSLLTYSEPVKPVIIHGGQKTAYVSDKNNLICSCLTEGLPPECWWYRTINQNTMIAKHHRKQCSECAWNVAHMTLIMWDNIKMKH